MTDQTPDHAPDTRTVRQIPLSEIDPDALPRDRIALAEAELEELKSSIVTGGLRMPVELFPLAAPNPPVRWGLLSGYRRFHAMRQLHAFQVEAGIEPPRFATIPAFIRPRAALAEQLAAVVEENEIRAALSPWERAHVAVAAWRRRLFASIDEAVEKLYPAASRQKRSRLRAIAQVVEELDGCLAAPELLSERQLLRLSHAVQAGFGEIMRDALESSARITPEAQWELILPYLLEAERPALENAPPPREGYPRRLARIRRGLVLRRAMTPDGWVLHFSGEEATSDFVSEIIDELERLYGR